MAIDRMRRMGLLAALPLVVAAGCAKKQEGMVAQGPAEGELRAFDTLPPADRDFMLQASAANLAATRVGQLGMDRGESDRVKNIGRDLVDTHTKLAAQLRDAAARERVAVPSVQLSPDQQQLVDQLSGLSGAQFDQAFLNAVVNLQHQTIASFQNEAMHGQDAVLAEFANQSLPTLNDRARFVQRQMAPPL